MQRFDQQNFLFESKPGRKDLLDYAPRNPPRFKVAIYRNHSFELIEHTIKAYLDYADCVADFVYSDYDDSLSFLGLDRGADLLILWLDLGRYTAADPGAFVAQRLTELRASFNRGILVVPFGGELAMDMPQVTTLSLRQIEEKLGERFMDLRLEPFTGTRMSAAACAEVARLLGLRIMPALLRPSLKCVVVDLDNTLYRGVLGEDGKNGVVLTDAHRDLQAELKALAKQGFFLCVASKNNHDDVLELFQSRDDFPLDVADFSVIRAHWDSKASSIADIARTLNIHPDSFLFIDDNLGELASVLQAHPSIKAIWAKDDAAVTLDALRHFPGLLKLSITDEDRLRQQDILANQKRQELSSAGMSKEEYIRSLNMELTYGVNLAAQRPRVAELSKKTNQFIFAYRRYTEADIERLMTCGQSAVVTVSLRDMLSDSGIVGVVVVTRHGDEAVLEECFVSCRALGRGIDEAIVLGAIRVALDRLGVGRLRVDFQDGERNTPARNFADANLAAFLTAAQPFDYTIPAGLVRTTIQETAQ